VKGGTPEVEATFRGQLILVRMPGSQTILSVYSTQCMLHSVQSALGVGYNSVLTHDHGMETYRGMTKFCILQ